MINHLASIAAFVASVLKLEVATGASVAAALGTIGACIALVGLVIFVAIYLAQNDQYQDWRECCTFGVLANADSDLRFKTLDEELSKFKKALNLEIEPKKKELSRQEKDQQLGDAMKKAAETNPDARYALSQRTR